MRTGKRKDGREKDERYGERVNERKNRRERKEWYGGRVNECKRFPFSEEHKIYKWLYLFAKYIRLFFNVTILMLLVYFSTASKKKKKRRCGVLAKVFFAEDNYSVSFTNGIICAYNNLTNGKQ